MSTGEYFPRPTAQPAWEVMQQLSERCARVYECRMSTNPPRTVAETARLLGCKDELVKNAWKAIRAKLGYDPLAQAKELGLAPRDPANEDEMQQEQLRAVQPEVLARLLEMRAESVLREITPAKIREAKLRDLTAGAKELLSMRQLIRGEPTQILATQQRDNMFRLMPQFIKEAQRRGYAFEIDGSGEIRTLKKVPKAKEPAALPEGS